MRTFTRLFLLVFLLGFILRQAIPAAGQDTPGGSLIIGMPEAEAFPTVRFRVEAYDAQGSFLTDLRASDFEILEDGQAIPLDSLRTVQNGLQITAAVNIHPSLNYAVNGTTPFAEIQAALADWARAQPNPTLDDFSLATPTGLHLIRSTSPEAWEKAILDYDPDLNRGQINLTSLADALDLATDPLGRPQMKRAILYITPPLPPSMLSSLPDYTSRARQIGVSVYVWMVAPSATAEIAAPLQDLASQTGGRLHVLHPADTRPAIETQLINLRSLYEVTYTSQVANSGSHRLSIRIKQPGGELVSNERNLTVTVLPPNPIFLSPPLSLQFQTNPAGSSDTGATLTPEEVELNILVEFPDQHERELKATRLFVNGKLVAENLAPPFDRFIWKIADISETGQQMLRVEALDELGISGTSLEIPVEVVVERLSTAPRAAIFDQRSWLVIAAVLVAGGALSAVLLSSGRRQKINWRRRQSRSKDPITQPVPGVGAVNLPLKKGERATQPRKADADIASTPSSSPSAVTQPARARLLSLMENEQPVPGGAIPLYEEEVTFGSDAERAIQVLSSSTVDGLHARIYCNADGEFCLADQHSVAGTWINYAPVSEHGARLEHGDLVHIGRVMFRFERMPASLRRPVQIIPMTEKLEQTPE